jgi:hypothetical protein
MAERILFPEWRKENQTTKYPFAMESTLSNGSQTLLEGILLDAILYPVGGQERMRLSRVDVAFDSVTLWIGDDENDTLASGQFLLPTPQAEVPLVDAYNRPAGLLLADPQQLVIFSTWGIGSFTFTVVESEFAATCCVPTPEIGVRGILLEDGSMLTGDVWFVGDDGVVLSLEETLVPGTNCGDPASKVMAIRVDVVGDPLFKRRLCSPNSLFSTPNFVKTITFTDGAQSFVCGPDQFGDVKMTVNNNLAADTVLRIHPTSEGTKIEVVGSVNTDATTTTTTMV